MSQRVLIFGSSGQLGGDLLPLLKADSSFEVKGLSHSECSVEDPVLVEKVINEFNPFAVVNCTSYNFVDRAESDPKGAFGINSSAVATMARLCGEKGIYFVHFSTDYVFDGQNKRAYREEDPVHPINIYGLSKWSGEEAVRILCPNHCIIRTVGLYGFRRNLTKYNFIEKIIAQAETGATIRVKSDSFTNPTYAWELARSTIGVLKQKLQGTYHGANTGSCSWYDYAREILKLSGLSSKAPIEPIQGDFGTVKIRRPVHSVLDPKKYQESGVQKLSSWNEALMSYFQRRKQSGS